MSKRQPLNVGQRRLGTLVIGATIALAAAACSTSSGTAKEQPSVQAERSPKVRVQLVTPETLSGLPKSLDRGLINPARQSMGIIKLLVGEPTSAAGWAYGGSTDTQDVILIAGAAGVVADPAKALDQVFAAVPAATDVRPVEPGPLGGKASCSRGETNGRRATVCAWADGDSIGMVSFLYLKDRDRTADFLKVREQVETPVG